MEVRQDQAEPGRDSTNPEAPQAKPPVPPKTRVPLIDLDSDWERETAVVQPTDGLEQTSVKQPSATTTPETPASTANGAQTSNAQTSNNDSTAPRSPDPAPHVVPEEPATAATRASAQDASDTVEVTGERVLPTTPVAHSKLRTSRRAAASTTPRPDGFVEPAKDDPLEVRPSLSPLRNESAGGLQRTGHPVRDRLLAKAQEASKSESQFGNPTPSSPGSDLSGMDQELERLAGPRQQLLSRPMRLGNAVLSPGVTLLGVTLIGLAAIASLFLLLVQFAPRNPVDSTQTAVADPSAITDPGVSAPVIINLPPPVPPPERKKEPGPWRIGTAEANQKVVRGSIGTNPFLKAVQEAGIEKNQAYRIYGALKEHKDFDRCRAKDEFVALINRADKRVVAFEYIVSKEEIYQAREDNGGKLIGKPLDLKVNKHRVQGSILVTSAGFVAAAKHAGLEPAIANVVNRALSGHTNTSQFRPGDRLRVVAQEITVLGEFHRYAGIEALEYVPVDGTPTRIYYHAAKKQYYDAKGRAPGEGGWRNPVRGAPITSKFNPQRMHPILKKKMPHNGTDFGAPTGTPIYAASYGKITKLGNYGPNGNYIAIAHDNGYESGYSHLSRFEPGLKVGDQVKRAQVIGYVGTTGRSTGPHLHFSVRKNGAYIDAESLHLDALTVLPPAERAIFEAVKQKYDTLLEAVALPDALPPQLVAAAPAATESEMHGDEMDDEGVPNVAPPTAVAPPAVVATPTPPGNAVGSAPPAVNAVAPVVTPNAVGGAFFLTDKELLSAQPAVDDGEVEE